MAVHAPTIASVMEIQPQVSRLTCRENSIWRFSSFFVVVVVDIKKIKVMAGENAPGCTLFIMGRWRQMEKKVEIRPARG